MNITIFIYICEIVLQTAFRASSNQPRSPVVHVDQQETSSLGRASRTTLRIRTSMDAHAPHHLQIEEIYRWQIRSSISNSTLPISPKLRPFIPPSSTGNSR